MAARSRSARAGLLTELVEFDRRVSGGGAAVLAGVDEAGRGALAGPVVAAAVICDHCGELDGVRDSKLISESRREALYEIILKKSAAWSTGTVWPEEIDRINILNATLKAMKIAVESLPVKADLVIVDGRKVPDIDIPASPFTGGDGRSFCIAAASIVAKVFRDRIMRELCGRYRGYSFRRNKGYGTGEHKAAIRRLGITEIHRKSFRH
ncbi:MAG: ribonuclease HII [Candidatus Latescibacteria bacterium]|nr:ribonuclease HII [bacterium]MBD3422885.1 ribonuclease HII [Candidatus Latescibacterota bacterium]